MEASKLENIRCSTIVLGISNAAVVLLGGFLILVVYPACERQYVLPFLAVSLVSCIRIVAMVQSGIAQEATAKTILESPGDTAAVVDTVMRRERRVFGQFLPFRFVVVVFFLFSFVLFLETKNEQKFCVAREN